jgi:peptidase M28-like protein/PDZ domain-containing protein
MFRKFLNVALILSLALPVAVFGQKQSSQLSVDRLRKDVTYLASGKLDGRRTGTQGATDAADYIAGEFSQLGLKPGMQAGAARARARYLQPFPYVSDVQLGGNNRFFVAGGHSGGEIQLRNEWMPLGFSSNGVVKNLPFVFAGYGITSRELKYDDYAVSNARDKMAIIFSGTPDGDNPHGQFTQAGQVRFKVAAARAAGVRALLIIATEEKLGEDKLARLSYDNAGEAGLPVMVISRRLAGNILGILKNRTLADFEKAADARTVTDDLRELRLPLPIFSADISVDVIRRESPSHNVIGILPGSDPKLKDEAVVIGAHYDHLGRGGQGSLAQREGEIHHGADDNASGTAALLELARTFSKQRPRRTVVFIAFSGEEEGLIGSNYYVNHPVVPLANTVAMINLDMVGRLNEKKLVVGGVGTAQEWRSVLDQQNLVNSATVSLSGPAITPDNVASNHPLVVGANGRPVVTLDPSKRFSLTMNEDGYGPSDHSSFYAKQIPVLFFWTGTHADYHKPSDTAEKINYDGLANVVSFVANLVRSVDQSDKRPTYTVAKVAATGRSTGFRVYLGTIPNYADSSDGMLLDGVRDDSPAAKAGLKAGDKIVKMAGRDVTNVYDYTSALGEMKGGQEYEVEIMRAGQRMTLKITPEARK